MMNSIDFDLVTIDYIMAHDDAIAIKALRTINKYVHMRIMDANAELPVVNDKEISTAVLMICKQFDESCKKREERSKTNKNNVTKRWENKNSANDAFIHAFDALDVGIPVTLDNMANYLNISIRAVRARAKELGYRVEHGVVTKGGDAE